MKFAHCLLSTDEKSCQEIGKKFVFFGEPDSGVRRHW